MFTPSGTGYYHEFLISMAYGKTVQCIENSSVYVSKLFVSINKTLPWSGLVVYNIRFNLI